MPAELGQDLGRDLVGGGVAIGLGRDRDGLGELGRAQLLDGIEHVVAVVDLGCVRERDDRTTGGDHAGDELALQGDRLLDPHLAGLEPIGEHFLVDLAGALGVVREALLGAAGLDHHDRHVAAVELTTGDDELEHARFALGVGRVRDPLTVGAVGDADRADRPIERDAADHQRGRGGVDRQHVVGVLLVGADHSGDDLGLVAEVLGERRAQRPVGQAAGEDGVLGGATFTTEERTGDLAGGVRALLDVDRQGEEIRPWTYVAGGVGGGQHRRASDAGNDSALTLLGEFAGLEGERLVGTGNGTRDANGISHEWLLSDLGFFIRRVDLERPGRFPVGDPVAPCNFTATGWATGNRRLAARLLWSNGRSALRTPGYRFAAQRYTVTRPSQNVTPAGHRSGQRPADVLVEVRDRELDPPYRGE